MNIRKHCQMSSNIKTNYKMTTKLCLTGNNTADECNLLYCLRT